MKKGFTLIELLLVVALIGILSTVLIFVVNPLTQFQKTRDVQRKNDLAQMKRALEAYYNDHGYYPQSNNYKLQDSLGTHEWGASTWNAYMPVLPKDPLTTQRYIYTSSDNQTYRIYAHLERGANDPDACSGGNDCPAITSIIQNGCGNPAGASCNYGVTSQNVSP